MKKKMKKLHRSNQGFTLMELIVTMLISSIVTAAVAGFLSMGLNYYRRTNVETALQTESQVAELFLTELLQEAQDYNVLDVGNYPAGVDYAVEVKREGNLYIVAQKGDILVYGQVENPAATETERIQSVTSKGMEEVFLARYVETFTLDRGKLSDTVQYQNGLVKLELKFVADGKTYTGTQTVLLRNKIKN